MNQDQVEEILVKYLPEDVEDFRVIFTGKESSKVDGLYNRETSEIIIHNRNFKSENELLYTAFHELAHHIDLKGKTSNRSHTKSFYIILNSIVDKAIINGDYQDIESEFLNTVLETGKEQTRLMKRMGKELAELYDYCKHNKIAFEDVVIRKTGMTGAEAKSIMKMYAMDISEELTGDLARKVAKIKDPEERKEAEEKKALPPAKAPKDPEDEEVFLTKEKARLEKQDVKICTRIGEIDLLLEGLGT